MPTHTVSNVVPPRPAHDVAAGDVVLQAALDRAGVGGAARTSLTELGELAGSPEARQWAREANRHGPELQAFDPVGHRVDEVGYHPAYHALTEVAVSHGLHAAPWRSDDPAAHTVRAAGFYVWSQVEAGHGCPISMTYSVVPALRHDPALAARYEPGLTSRTYDFGLREPSTKAGLLAGMAMTEKQGGSDVRANTTRAVPSGDHHLLTGHKWFCSAPMGDLFLVLAQTPDGIGCFLVPRVLPDGSRNRFLLQRLKDKLGNRSNASAEVEFDDTVGWPVGEPGRGVRTILEMVTMTRLDCVLGSAAGQRAAVTEAVHHATHRSAFGTRLVEAPAMREVLADLIVESAAATALSLRLARAVDQGESAFLRLAVAAAKFWVCKRTLVTVGEALECLGGNGYVEDSAMPRLLRESPVNSIWEGSGNVVALDVVRAVGRDPASLEAVLAECAPGVDPALDAAITRVRLLAAAGDPASGRALAGLLARCLQASVLVREHDSSLAERFLATRVATAPPAVLGEHPGPRTSDVLATVTA